MGKTYSFHHITNGIILLEELETGRTNSYFLPNYSTYTTKDMEDYLTGVLHLPKSDIKTILHTWEEIGAINPLKEILQWLSTEEWANGSDRIGEELDNIKRTGKYHFLHKDSILNLSEDIHNIYFKEMENLINREK